MTEKRQAKRNASVQRADWEGRIETGWIKIGN